MISLDMNGRKQATINIGRNFIESTESLVEEAEILEALLFQGLPEVSYVALFQSMIKRQQVQKVTQIIATAMKSGEPQFIMYHPDGEIEALPLEEGPPEDSELPLEPSDNEGLDN